MSVTQLVNACKQADIEQLKQLLAEHGKDINQPCPSEKCTCLHMAVISGSDPIADLLLEHGADPTVQADDEMGITPMHMAAMFGRLTFIQKCLKLFPRSVNTVDKTNATPIMSAALYNQYKALELLLDNGANPNIKEHNKFRNVLHVALTGDNEGCYNEIAKLILSRGCDVNAQDASGFTALHMAVNMGDESLCSLFLNYGADPKVTTNHGANAISLATKLKRVDLARFLTDRYDRVSSLRDIIDAQVAPWKNQIRLQQKVVESLQMDIQRLQAQVQSKPL